jgi:hypothetical protein
VAFARAGTMHNFSYLGGFISLTERKIWCVMEAESKGAIVAWFEKMGIEHDGIWPVEIEGDHGTMTDLRPEAAMAGMSSR